MADELAEPWDDPAALYTWLHRLLVYILDHGPTTDDVLARQCLRPAELIELAPESERAAIAAALVAGLSAYLDAPAHQRRLDETLERWRYTIGRLRAGLNWSELPPETADRARKRAELLLLHCQRHRWLIRHGANRWRLTETGLEAVDHFYTDGVHPEA